MNEEFDHLDRSELEPRPRKGRRRSSGRAVRVILLLLLAAVIWFVCGAQPVRATTGAGARASGRCTVLIAGTDRDGYRTDTIMLLSLDSKGREARLLSRPRDTHVDAPYSVPKINSACGYAGGGKAGMEELMTQVKALVGFMPDGYALVDLDAFVKIVDMMGGVDFNVPVNMHYSDPSQGLEINLSAGEQHLDGAQAIQLVRFRSGYAQADITRTQVQRDFVKAAFSQWASLKNIVKLPQLAKLVHDNVTTDLSLRNILWLGRTLLRCGVSNLQTDILPGSAKYIGRGSYYVADAAAVSSLMNSSYSPYR